MTRPRSRAVRVVGVVPGGPDPVFAVVNGAVGIAVAVIVGIVAVIVDGGLLLGLELSVRDRVPPLARVLDSQEPETDTCQAHPEHPPVPGLFEPVGVERQDDEGHSPQNGQDRDGTDAVNVHWLDVRRLPLTTPSFLHIRTG
nr:hypothetical protein [Phytoactinopolyspora endophytica]